MSVRVTGKTNCKKCGPCVNADLQTWGHESKNQGGTIVNVGNTGVQITAAAGALALAFGFDHHTSVLPGNDFCIESEMQVVSGSSAFFGLSNGDIDSVVEIATDGTNFSLQWRRAGVSATTYFLAPLFDRALHKIKMCKRAGLISVHFDGLASQSFSLNDGFPTIPLNPIVEAGNSAVARFFKYCLTR